MAYENHMDKKAKCKEIMLKYFGPNSAKLVDSMDEQTAVEKCRAKVAGFFGEETAKKEFNF